MPPREATADRAVTGCCERGQRDCDIVPTWRGPLRPIVWEVLIALALLLSATTGIAQPTAPDETVQPDAEQAPPSPADAARAALESDHRSLLELQQLQLRENELWQVRNRESMKWRGIGLGLGVTGAATMLPVGSVFLASAGTSNSGSSGGEPSDDDPMQDSFRIIGASLIGLGVVAMLVAVYCGIRVRDLRTTRHAADAELSEIRQHRIRVIDALALPSEVRHGH